MSETNQNNPPDEDAPQGCNGEYCVFCQSEGVCHLHKPAEATDCPTCKGKGTIGENAWKHVCHDCFGTGESPA